MNDSKKIVICSWCNRIMEDGVCIGDKLPKENDIQSYATHGICKECFEKEKKKI